MLGKKPPLKRVPHMSKRMLKAQHVHLTFPTIQALFRLMGNALKVYVCLCQHADMKGIAFPSIVRMAWKTHLDRGTVAKHIHELERLRLIEPVDVRRPHKTVPGWQLYALVNPKVETLDPEEYRQEAS